MDAMPSMAKVVGLGRSGPFPETSQRRWFVHPDGLLRRLTLAQYYEALVESQVPAPVAWDINQRMARHGAREVLWITAQGGRRGHVNVAWDVRVACTTTPAAEAVPDVVAMAPDPLGTTPIQALQGVDGVLTARSHRSEPTTLKLPLTAGPKWIQALRLPGKIRNHYTRISQAALATGNVGATAMVAGGSITAVEHALAELLGYVVDDMRAGST